MNTYLFNNENQIILTESTGAIIEKSNSIDSLKIVLPKDYNGYNMAEFDGLFEWILPISHTTNVSKLVLTDENYKEDYLLYTLPESTMTTSITAEPGEVQFSLTFVKAEIDENEKVIERVRQSAAAGILKITPVTTWLSPSEAALSSLAELYLENKRLALTLADIASGLNANKIDDIKIDLENEKLVGTSNGTAVGDGIDLAALNAELVEIGGKDPNNGNVHIQSI